MLGSLRVRLPLVFLAGIMLAGLVTTLIAVQLFREFAHDQALAQAEPRGERDRAALLESVNASYASTNGKKSTDRRRRSSPRRRSSSRPATRIYFVGPAPARSRAESSHPGLQPLPVEDDRLDLGQVAARSSSRRRGTHRALLRGRESDRHGQTGHDAIGAIVVATQKTDVSDARLRADRAAGARGRPRPARRRRCSRGYLSRRIVRPVLAALRRGRRGRARRATTSTVPRARARRARASERAVRRDGGTARRGRGDGAQLPDVGLARAPHAADRDPRSRRGAARRRRRRPGERAARSTTVEAEAQRLERLVGDILDLAKLDTHRFTVTDGGGRHGAARRPGVRAFRDEARRRSIDYRQEVRDRPVIVSDGDRVLQIVGNLLSNAFRATPDGGRISLELAQRTARCSVAVEDNGPGHPAGDARAAVPPVRLRDAAAAPGSGSRSRRSSRRRSAVGSTSSPRSGSGSRFELVLPAR